MLFQKRVEYAIITLVNIVHNITNNENLVLGGGVAMNSVCNKKIANNVKFKQVLFRQHHQIKVVQLELRCTLINCFLKKFVKTK